MEQIVITHPSGTLLPLTSKGEVRGITKAEQTITLLGEDIVNIIVKAAAPVDFYIGDKIDVYGKTYTLNQLPIIKKVGRNFEYALTFEGVQYELIDVQWLLPIDDAKYDSLNSDLDGFIDILIHNANRVYPGKWKKGTITTTGEQKTLTYKGKNCLEVLQKLCEEYDTEFEITQSNGIRTINIKKAGVTFPYTFSYGRTGGLYQLTRQNINTKNVVTRLYVYGGSNNLGSNYRYTNLCLPGLSKNTSFIENSAAVEAFGVKENTKTFEEIYPNRYGEVTAGGSKFYSFIDNTMNFDLNEKEEDGKTTKWLINGVAAKLKVTSGNLAGYEFEIHKYINETKEIQVVPFVDENGMKFPSETSAAFQFKVGDKYIFTDINLPDAYKEEAETKLLTEGEEYYDQYCQPQVQYGLSIDQNFIKQFAGELTIVNLFAVGDYIQVKDTDIGLDKSIRITAFTRDLLQPYKYAITVGDKASQNITTRVISDLQKIDEVIKINNLTDPAKARRNWRSSQEVLASVFDPEGNYFSEKIKPLSIETTMLAVGSKSMQFVLQNTLIEANYEGNKNAVKVTGGTLSHYTIAEEIRTWSLASASMTLTSDTEAYYIYAKCKKEGNVGAIIFSSTQIKVNEDPLNYHFWIGVLNSVLDGVRAISLTYGATTINGRFIKTGRIESQDGKAYFDLDSGTIGGRIKFLSSGAEADLEEEINATVVRVDVEYALSTSRTVAPTTGWNTVAPEWQQGKYMWSRVATYYKSDPQNAKYSNTTCIAGAAGKDGYDGLPGKDGVGIVSTTIRYAQSTNGTTAPSSGWQSQPPALIKGQYLWTKTTWRYTDSTSETGYSVTYIAKDGNDGYDGLPGKDGVGIVSTTIRYAQSTNGTTAPSSGWQSQPPALIKGQYLWTKTTWRYTDSTSETGYSVTYIAKDGNDGYDGLPGKDGVGIVSTTIRYAQSTNGTTAPSSGWQSQVPSVPQGQYLWTKTTWIYTDGTNETGYSVAKMGEKGDRGSDGTRIVSITEEYYLSTSKNSLTGGQWQTTPPKWEYGKYIWTRTRIKYKNPTSEETTTPIVSSEWEAVNELEIGGRNLARHIDMSKWKYTGRDVYGDYYRFASSHVQGINMFPSIIFKENTQYALSFKAIKESGVNPYFKVVYTDGTSNNIVYNKSSLTYYSFISAKDKTIDKISHSRNSDGMNRVYEFQITRGHKILDFQPAPEDIEAEISKAQAAADRATAITDKFGTTVEGGLVQTVTMLLREANSEEVTAGITGLQGGGSGVAFWSGGTYEEAIASLAKIILRHDGTGRIGILDVNSAGDVIVYDENSKERFAIRKSNLVSLAELVSQSTATKSASQTSGAYLSTDSEIDVSGLTLYANEDGGSMLVTGKLRASIILHDPDKDAALVNVAAELHVAGSYYATIATLNGRSYPQGGGGYNSGVSDFELTINREMSVPQGRCKVVLKMSSHLMQVGQNSHGASFNSSMTGGSMTWKRNLGDYRRINFAKNGMMLAYKDKHLYYSDETGLDVKGATNLPGVLASATVNSWGGRTNIWGAKAGGRDVEKTSDGGGTVYRVYHTIGHSNYTVQVIPAGWYYQGKYVAVAVAVTGRTSNYFDVIFTDYGGSRRSSIGFDYVIIGRNY